MSKYGDRQICKSDFLLFYIPLIPDWIHEKFYKNLYSNELIIIKSLFLCKIVTVFVNTDIVNIL